MPLPSFFRRQKLVKKQEKGKGKEDADHSSCSIQSFSADESDVDDGHYNHNRPKPARRRSPARPQNPTCSTPSAPSYPSHRSTSNPVPPTSPPVQFQPRVFSNPPPYFISTHDPSLPPPYSPYDSSHHYTNHGSGSVQTQPPPIPGVTTLPSGDTELRLHFHGLNYLKQTALGVRDAKAVLVYIRQRSARHGFCMHMDPDPSRDHAQEHRYWDMRAIPDRLVCPGRQNRVIYQLSRSLWKHLHHGGDDSPGAVHRLLARWLTCLPSRCITCGDAQAVSLCRPTVCCSRSGHCATQLRLSTLDVRLLDVRQDPSVAELLLTAVYAAAQADHPKLLPASPWARPRHALAPFAHVPAVGRLAAARDIAHALRDVHAERLLCYAGSQYRGFLMSAPRGPYHVAGLPTGTTQFLLADAGPQLEAKFEAARTARPPARAVYFHGTTFDRLYAILAQGLRVLSSDPALCRNGASWGCGIYLTDATSMALSYAGPIRAAHRGAPDARPRNMLFYRSRVLLCCELACPLTAKTGGVFVLEDSSRVILRYVFLLPEGSVAIANEALLKTEIEAKFLALRNERRGRNGGLGSSDRYAFFP